MDLVHAIRLSGTHRIAIVGAGGKTTALFGLARQMPAPVWVSATTHLALDQLKQADRCLYVSNPSELNAIQTDQLDGVSLFMQGPSDAMRTHGLDFETLDALKELADQKGISLLVEADGSRMMPLKAPADYEPAIPAWADTVIVCAGLSGLGKPLVEGEIHRPQRFAELSGLKIGDPVSEEGLIRVLLDEKGGLKGIPSQAKRVALLNQTDRLKDRLAADRMARRLCGAYDAVLVAALKPELEDPVRGSEQVQAVYEPMAGIILAAGGSRRLEQPKQLLLWRGETLVRHTAKTALQAGLSPVIVVTGASAEAVENELADLPVQIVRNPNWEDGQSSSIKAGIGAIVRQVGAALFLLGDQPQVPVELIDQLVSAHSHTMGPLIAPRVKGRRANPVLFDQVTFPSMLQLQGDVGGRAIFSEFPFEYVDWTDENLLLDVDTAEDYQRLLEIE